MKNITLSFFLLICCSSLSAQTETKYLDYKYEICKKRNAVYTLEITELADSVFKKIKNHKSGKLVAIYKHHKANEKVVYAYNYNTYNFLENERLFINSRKEGEWKYYNSDGKKNKILLYKEDVMITERYFNTGFLAIELPYKDGRYNGVAKVYTKVGTIARKVTFENGNQINLEDIILYDSLNKDSTERIITECMPTFVGGEQAMMRYIAEMVNYPKEAVNKGIQGTVNVRFTVDKDGKTKDVIIVSKTKIGYGCEEEAIRVIKSMPRWNPGLQNGIAVSVYFSLPIKFRLY